ncbi:DUF3040 domain-containing protein [Nocardiopsis sp. RSe5-2]|uniref:DUF3040 domain-containing protein n=1 Tax=Nocardiopsis endophytica TaxID=3018445 RepID=A0ABT4UDI8_9ACTN|nr:DUF3040 domain-containing protein [Nocardiopsis endophytica]MDA2814980.1 DUF3040 domain-containing protein [Nocardiopsis endophytica]
MPLSEHEQRMLDQIEQALYAEDPKFANTVRHTNPAVHYKRWIIKASIGFVLGIAVLMGGMILQQPVVGALGFLIMLACALWGLSGWRKGSGGTEGGGNAPQAQAKQPRQQKPGMMNRFEERWRRRQEGDG